MKLRHFLILGLLVFLNGFVLTVLFLMVSNELARPAPTSTPVVTMEPPIQPTFTSTPTEVSPPTSTTEPTATSTLVVPSSTPAPTNTPAPPTSTPVPPTPTFTVSAPTSTAPAATATPTTPPASPTPTSPSYQYSMKYIEYLPNCGLTFIEGTVWNPDGVTQRSDVRVKVWTAGWEVIRVTPTDAGKGPGYYDVILSTEGPREGNWFVAVVDANGNPLSDTVSFDTNTTNCEPGGTGHQWVIVDFKANY